MSTNSNQQTLDGDSLGHPSKDHLSKDKKLGSGTDLKVEAPSEWYCKDCGRRVTEGPSGIEYGHSKKRASDVGRCEHRDGPHSPEVTA